MKVEAKDVSQKSKALAEDILHENLVRIKSLLDADDSIILERHHGQFAIDVLKLVRIAMEEGKPSGKEFDAEALRNRLRVAIKNGEAAKEATA